MENTPTGNPAHTIPEISNAPFGYGTEILAKKTRQVAVKDETPVNDDQGRARIGNYYKTSPLYQKKKTRKTITVDNRTVKAWTRLNNGVKILIGVSIAALLAGIIYFSLSQGLIGALISTVAATFPFALIIVAAIWLTRYNPLPKMVFILALLWGAAGSILLTFATNDLWVLLAGEGSGMMESVALRAPVTEEFSKGIGVLIICLIFHKKITSTLNGGVIAMLAGGGFAFTENILYLGNSFVQYGTNFDAIIMLGITFVVRGVMSPFAHALFSLPMGLIIGHALSNQRFGWFRTTLAWLSIIPVSMLLHALWNGSTLTTSEQTVWYVFYVVVQIPLFLISYSYITWLRQEHINRTYRYLNKYAQAGWFSYEEAETLGTVDGRHRLQRWADHTHPLASVIVKDLEHTVMVLSMVRHQLTQKRHTKNVEQLKQEEANLLNRTRELKEQLYP